MFDVSGKKIYHDRKITIKLFRVPNPHVSGSGLGMHGAAFFASGQGGEEEKILGVGRAGTGSKILWAGQGNS